MVRGMRTKQMRSTMTNITDNTFYIYYKQWQGNLSNILHWFLAFLSGHVQVPGFFLHFRMIHQNKQTDLPQTSISHMYPRICYYYGGVGRVYCNYCSRTCKYNTGSKSQFPIWNHELRLPTIFYGRFTCHL